MKSTYYNESNNIVNLLINNKFKMSLFELVDQYIKDESKRFIILNEISSLLAEYGYEIICISPIKIEKR